MIGVLLVLILAAGVCALYGVAVSWLLGFFGLAVPWYACAVGWFVLANIARMLRGGGK